MNFEDKLKNHFQTIKSSTYSFKDLSSLLSSNRQEIAQAMIEMRTDNQLKFEIITEDTFRITEIDGDEFQFTSTTTLSSSPTNKGLFDRDGNIFVEPHEFLEVTTNYQTKKYDIEEFKELEKLKNEDYEKKVLEIAHENVRLIVRKIYPLTFEATSDELRVMYKHVLMGLCRAVEKHEYKRGNTFSTYAMTWIVSGLGRSRVKIVIERCKNKYNGFSPTIHSVSQRYALLNKENEEYPTLNEVVETYKAESEAWHLEDKKRKERKAKEKERLIGINILFRELTDDSDALPTEEQIKLIVDSLNSLDIKERDILLKRYGLHGDMKNRQATLENIGQDYGLTRERIRQIIKISLESLKVSWDSASKFESFLKCTWESILYNMRFLDTRKSRLAEPIGRIDIDEIDNIVKLLESFQIINFQDYVDQNFDTRKNIQLKIGNNLDWFLCKGLTYIENSGLMKIEEFSDQYKTLHLSALFIDWKVEKLLVEQGHKTIENLDTYSHKIDDPVYPLVIQNLIRLELHQTSLLPLSEFSQRTRNVFVKNNIYTLDQLTSHSKQSLLNLNSFGTTSLIEVISYLDKLGIILGSHKKDITGDDLINFNALSERTKNCLKSEEILTIKQLENLTSADLMQISNFGKQSLIDVKRYLNKFGKKLKEFDIQSNPMNIVTYTRLDNISLTKDPKRIRKKLFSLSNELSQKPASSFDLDSIDISRDLLLFPTGNKAAFENYNKTVENFYMNNDLKDVVAKENFTILSEPNENNGYWGVNTSVTVMNKIITPCYGIFFKDKKGFKLAKIRNKFIDVNLSSMFWEKLSNEAFKYMFQIESIADINIKQDEFNHLVNWSEKMVTRMFTHFEYPKSYMVLNYLKQNQK